MSRVGRSAIGIMSSIRYHLSSLVTVVLMALGGHIALQHGQANAAEKPLRPAYWPLLINGYAFPKLELALTPMEQARGLMFREKVPNDGGMIFVFPESSQRSFWMKNTLVPLDLLFLDADGKVVAIHRMQPEMPQLNHESEWAYEERLKHYPSYKEARLAIEFAAGQAEICGISVGDSIDVGMAELLKIAAAYAIDD